MTSNALPSNKLSASEQGGLESVSLKGQQTLVALLRAGAPPGTPAALPPPDLSPDEWEELLPLARKNGVSGLLYRAIETLPRNDVPPPVRAALRDVYLSNNLSQLLALDELGTLLDEFAQANIPMIVLKGAALAPTLYPDAALRPFGDLDLLVHEGDEGRAAEILFARGYQGVVQMGEGTDSELWGQQTFVRGGAHPARIELHRHLFVQSYYRRRSRLDWFWAHRTPFRVQGRTAFMLDASAQLLHLAAHSALHHQDSRLIWSYDLALLVSQQAARLDWYETIETAQAFGLALSLRHALQEMSTLWQLPLTPQAQAFVAQPKSSWSERAMFSLARSRYREARWLADGLGVGLTYWLSHLFPAPAYMLQHYRVRHPILLPFYYLARPFLGGFKFVRALFTLASDSRRSV